MVLEHDHGLELGLVTGLHEFRLAHNLRGLFRIQVSVFEQAGAEAVHQQAHGRNLEALTGALLPIFLHPHPVGVQHGAFLVVAAELVYAGFQHFEVALALGKGFHAPAFALEAFYVEIVLGDVPVCAGHPVEAVFVAEQVRDNVLVVAVAGIDSGRILVPGNGVIRHHGRRHFGLSLQVKGSFHEGTDMGGEVVTGVNGELAVAVMGVTAAFFRAAGGPVLDHGVHGLVAPAVFELCAAFRSLEAIHIGAGHVRIQVRILAEGAAEAAPARFSGQVDLRRQGRGNAQGPVFLGSDLSELLYQGRVEGGGHAQGRRPHGDGSAVAGVELGRCRGAVARVGGIVGGHAVAQAFHESLHIVVPLGGVGRRGYAGHQYGAEVILFEELLLGLGDFRAVDGLMAAVQHHAGDFIDGELGSQVFGTLQRVFPPVFVHIHLSVAVQVFERISALGQDLDAGSGAVPEGLSAFLGNEVVAVAGFFLPLGAAGNCSPSQDSDGKNADGLFHISRWFGLCADGFSKVNTFCPFAK